jgi:spermidine/putrescine transport system permease protein
VISERGDAGADVAAAPAAGGRGRGRLHLTRGMLMWPPGLYVLVLLIAPIALIALYSVNLQTNLLGVPTGFSTANWSDFLPPGSNPFWSRFLTSMTITLVVSVGAVLAAYPLAFFLAFSTGRRRYTLLLAMLAPFFTSYLLRVIAWQVILNNHGIFNSLLWDLGLRRNGDGIPWLIYSKFSVGLVLFYSWVPFVAVPMFVALENMDRGLIEAAHDLGANRLDAFLRVILPLSIPGVIAGFVFVLIPTTGEFITPLLVGGPDSFMFGNAIQSFFGDTPNWNYGAVLALWLVAVVIVMLAVFGRFLSADLQETRG